MGAIVGSLLTWWGAIPSSSSLHALIGGLIGAGAAKAGFSAVVWWGTLKTVAAIVWSPLLGFALALLLWLVLAWRFMRSTPFAALDKSSGCSSSGPPRSIPSAMAPTMHKDHGDYC